MEQEIKASIIVRAYNAQEVVARAIQSALAQDFPRDHYEVVIVDDGSTDGTARIVDSFVKESGVCVIHQKNQGAVLAANNGFAQARGEYVTLVDSDDECSPQLLKEAVPLMDVDPQFAFAYCDYAEEFEGERKDVLVGDVFKMLAGGTLWRRSLFKQEGWFRNSGMFDEYELILRTWGRWHFVHVPQSLYLYHRSRASLTGDPKRVEEAIVGLRKLYPQREKEIDRIRLYTLPRS